MSNLYADTIDPVRRTRPDEVFFIRIEARPTPGAEDFGRDAGAFVNCYINAGDLRAAEMRAIALIHAHDWHPVRLDSWHLTCLECASAEQTMIFPKPLRREIWCSRRSPMAKRASFTAGPAMLPTQTNKMPNLARGHLR